MYTMSMLIIASLISPGSVLSGSHVDKTLSGKEFDTGIIMEVEQQQPMRSRAIIENGERIEMKGLLKRMGGSWLLIVDGVNHELFLAPLDYQRKIGLAMADDKEAVIHGYFRSNENEEAGIIAVCTIELDGREFRIRNDDRSPMWQGGGRGAGNN